MCVWIWKVSRTLLMGDEETHLRVQVVGVRGSPHRRGERTHVCVDMEHIP